jgi:pyruvate formate lyase activating enzyme
MEPSGKRVYHRDQCTLCGACVRVCYAGALVIQGREVTVEDVMAEVRQDAAFYETSGGGVTLSGGEPLVQVDFAIRLLQQCKREGFHTAMDTCGYADWNTIETILPYVDLFLYDLKHMDSQKHREWTGGANDRILDNLQRLSRSGVPIEIRMPIIPMINDTRELIESAAEFLSSLENITAVRLLPYHRLAGSKYERLGMDNTMPQVTPPTQDRMDEIAASIRAYGLEVV